MTEKSLPRMFFADEKVPTVKDVDYDSLINDGKKAVVFDLDNTIAKWGDDSLTDEIVELFDRLTSMGLKVGILSNSKRKATEDFVAGLSFPHVFNANKPSVKGFRSILDKLDATPQEAVMIGDQIFTDVLGANRLGIYTVRVDPIDPDREFRFTKLNRIGEKFILCLREVYRALRSLKKTSR